MRFNDAILGVVLLAFGTAVFFYSQTFPGLPGQDYGPAFFPSILGVLFGICGVVLIVQGLMKRHEFGWVQLGDWASSPHHRTNFFVVIAALIFYILFSDSIGFIPIAIIMTTVLMYRFRVRILPALAMSTAATLVIHVAFYKFLLVPLPWGIIEPISW